MCPQLAEMIVQCSLFIPSKLAMEGCHFRPWFGYFPPIAGACQPKLKSYHRTGSPEKSGWGRV